ncbi:FadR/GntR family transcriptional regulator [Capillimicrobium parvum]|uniref:L-lactate dehydrogenase operon regulatory protein n=1 Tax=Capillimicrobium parvum TaxID=2884022 RepID=A0A9E6Y701_9ACTN|nr:FCD domain-containing protein [Capillimicrobium parvum]UGS39082.1 Putative L-lactate dehydrogenase operon regulatory protein [Capillimicrobium parvum]
MSTPTTSEALAAATTLVPLRIPAAHEVCADRLERAIHSGMFVTGERLPSERDLAAQLGVSRVTLREALARLEGSGHLVRTRGAQGGAVVAAPDEAMLRARLLARLDELADLSQFRAVIEGGAARLAAERAGPAEHAALRAALDALPEDDPRAFRRADTAFHLAVAHAAGNAVLLRAVADARERMFSLSDALPWHVVLETTRAGHLAVVEAIEARDGDGARAAMEAHVAIAQRELEQVLRGA